ncbi:MAG: tyrosine-type recombinase/integrase [Micromonosporaceae bacterium]
MRYTPDLPITGETLRWVDAIDRWSDWMRAEGLRRRTVEHRRYQLTVLGEAHLRRNPWSVRHDDLIEWMASQEWAPETRKSYRAALRSFYGWGKLAGHVRRDPAADLPPVRVPRGTPRPVAEGRLETAIAHASDRTRLILVLGAYAGLRRAEIAGLCWADVSDGQLRVVGKGGHARMVPIHPLLHAELATERARREDGRFGTGWRYTARPDGPHVFPGRYGKGATPDSIGRAAARALGGQGGHTLRHRFAARAYDATRDIGVVQQLLGHASPTTTAVYARADRTAMRDAVNAL